MASSFSVSSQVSQKYDVFLNFRGENVRFNFLSYLISALNQAGLNIFVDYKLKRGEHIKSALMDAIQDSKVSLTIFSEGYASSAWSLDELVKIMECRENPMLRQKVIPVFYHVTASDVRDQSGVFAKDFAKHESDCGSRGKVPLWRAAMAAAGCLSGRIVKETSPEVDVLMQIVNDVSEILGRNDPISNTGDNISKRTSSFTSIHAELHIFFYNQKEISSGKLKDCPNIQQLQGNGSIWTISKRKGVHVKELNTVLKSIEVQTGGKPSQSQSNRSETSSSHPCKLGPETGVSIRKLGHEMGVSIRKLASEMVGPETVGNETVSIRKLGPKTGVSIRNLGPETGVSIRKLGLEAGVSIRKLSPEMGVSIRKLASEMVGPETVDNETVSIKKLGPKTGVSIRNLGPEMGVSIRKLGPEMVGNETGVSIRKLGPETGVSTRKLGPEIGVSIRNLGPKTGVSIRKLGLEAGVSIRKLGPETGVSIRKLGPEMVGNETGVSIRKLGPETGVSTRNLGPETGVSIRNLSPETGVSIRKLGLEAGVSIRKLGPETGVSIRKLGPEMVGNETGVSIRKLGPETGVSTRNLGPKTGVSLRRSSPETGVSLRRSSPETGISLRKSIRQVTKNDSCS